MDDGFRQAGFDTTKGLASGDRFARRARVLNLFPMLLGHLGHWFFTEGIILVLPDFQDAERTGFDTVTTTVAFIRIDSYEIFAGSVLVSVVG